MIFQIIAVTQTINTTITIVGILLLLLYCDFSQFYLPLVLPAAEVDRLLFPHPLIQPSGPAVEDELLPAYRADPGCP